MGDVIIIVETVSYAGITYPRAQIFQTVESSEYLHDQSIHKQDHVYTGHSPPGAAGGRPREREWLAGTDE